MSTPPGLRLDPRSNAPTFLVGDVGGTNCRLALAQRIDGRFQLASPRRYKCADFSCAEQAIDHYRKSLRGSAPFRAAVIAIAGPISQGVVQSTNMPWRMSEAGLREYGIPNAKLINDYTALALSLEHLSDQDMTPIGPPLRGDERDTMAVIGAGTGFGVGAMARGLGGATAISTEGGHVSFAPIDDIEIQLLQLLMRRYGRVSIERLLSGPGLANLHWALNLIAARDADALTPEQIVDRALAGEPGCVETLQRFCGIYGSVAGDVALMFGARGGVFLGGGIAPGIEGFFKISSFRARFESKGRFQGYLSAIPTHIIRHDYAALLGSASVADRAPFEASETKGV